MKLHAFSNNSNKGQVVIEFMLLLGMAFFIIIILLASVFSVSDSTTKAKSYDDLNDLGMSLQEEFLLAAQLEDGYIRELYLPPTVNGKNYNISIGQSGNFGSYIAIQYDIAVEIYYEIPSVYGNITLGENVLRKNDGQLRIN